METEMKRGDRILLKSVVTVEDMKPWVLMEQYEAGQLVLSRLRPDWARSLAYDLMEEAEHADMIAYLAQWLETHFDADAETIEKFLAKFEEDRQLRLMADWKEEVHGT